VGANAGGGARSDARQQLCILQKGNFATKALKAEFVVSERVLDS
jgi:hypothetical protein